MIKKLKFVFISFMVISFLIYLLYSNLVPKLTNFSPDEVAKEDVVATSNTTITDNKKTEELKISAGESVQKIYQEDKEAIKSSVNKVNKNYSNLKSTALSKDANKTTQIEYRLNSLAYSENIQLKISTDKLASYLVGLKEENFENLQKETLVLVEEVMQTPITEETLSATKVVLNTKVEELSAYPQFKEIIRLVANQAIEPNMVFNEKATTQARIDAINKIEPVTRTIKTGEIIVRQGNRITEEQIDILEQLGIQKNDNNYKILFGVVLLALAFLFMLDLFFSGNKNDFCKTTNFLLLIAIFVTISIISKGILNIEISTNINLNKYVACLVPIATGSMLIAILVNERTAILFTVLMAVFISLLTKNPITFMIFYLVSGIGGILSLSHTDNLTNIIKSGFQISVLNVLTITSLNLILQEPATEVMLLSILLSIINGIISTILVVGALPYLENIFSLVSPTKLLAMTDSNKGLLRQLVLKAPGTYHHSLMVANLAEIAAEEIGANSLLTRVGAYYHDVGKMNNPEYYIENQMGSNPHDKLTPEKSSEIIKSHVAEGIELGKKNNLPLIVLDFIEQHHGNGLIKYFFNKSLSENKPSNVDKFRYDGATPKTKEVALVMLADSVEASIRSLQNPSEDMILQTISATIQNKVDEHQLDNCNLTFQDLQSIKESFYKTLLNIYHKRIEYNNLPNSPTENPLF